MHRHHSTKRARVKPLRSDVSALYAVKPALSERIA